MLQGADYLKPSKTLIFNALKYCLVMSAAVYGLSCATGGSCNGFKVLAALNCLFFFGVTAAAGWVTKQVAEHNRRLALGQAPDHKPSRLPGDIPERDVPWLTRNARHNTGPDRARTDRLLELLGLGVVCTDKAGKVHVFNPAAERILGMRAAQALGMDEQELWARAGIAAPELIGNTSSNFELNINGRYLLFSQTSLSAMDDGGKIVVINDVTDRRQYEDELARASTLSVVGEMAAGVAHEIRNPLVGIRGFAQLVLEKDGEAPLQGVKPYMEVIIGEVDRINKLITDFLTLAKPQVSQAIPVNLSELVRSTMSLAQNEAIMRDVNLAVRLAESVPDVLGDRDQLRQVFLNLLNNALAAAGPGGEVIIHTGVANKGVYLSITDNGPGIAPEIENRIFNPFFTTKDEGTGLGLSICQRIINAHNGRLNFSSSSRGTVFTFWLPCIDG
ncbi:two-component system sensor histidine kinase NtrB [Desulforudis sp. 1031]|uniref:two-component system sensor histidine kinase NtrB n=3 Tax=Candidatus Desulforudis TaxID=471826 RepID=UPI003CE4FCD6